MQGSARRKASTIETEIDIMKEEETIVTPAKPQATAPSPAKLAREAKRAKFQEAEKMAKQAIGEFGTVRRTGEFAITQQAAALLSLALPENLPATTWKVGSCDVSAVAGAIRRISLSPTASDTEKGIASALNSRLAPLLGFRLRLVTYRGKKVTHAATVSLT
jgi:hypothetical protein